MIVGEIGEEKGNVHSVSKCYAPFWADHGIIMIYCIKGVLRYMRIEIYENIDSKEMKASLSF